MEQRMLERIRTEGLLRRGDTVVIGISGGADSVCLFLLLRSIAAEWELSLAAAHIHHGIRGREADEDAAFVEELCRRYDTPCRVWHLDVPALAGREKLGLEEMGRKVRRQILASYARKQKGASAKVALAHHMDDAAETMLLALTRGTGLAGMGAIRARTFIEEEDGGDKSEKITLIRPLLGFRRSEIEAYLREKGQPWRTDSTNYSDDYTRNYMRSCIIPLFAACNPKAVEHFARTAELAVGLKEVVDAEAERFLQAHSKETHGLERKALAAVSPAFAGEVLLRWLGPSVKNVAYAHIQSIKKLVEGRPGRRVDLPGGWYVESGYTHLFLRKAGTEAGFDPFLWVDFEKPHPGEKLQVIFDGYEYTFEAEMAGSEAANIATEQKQKKDFFSICLNYVKIGEMCFRFPLPGDTMTVTRDGKHKKLRRIFIDAKVPGELRERMPLLLSDEDICWIVGLRDCPAYFVEKGDSCVLRCKARPLQKRGGSESE